VPILIIIKKNEKYQCNLYLEIEEDTQEIMHALQHKDSCWTRYGQQINDIRARLNSLQL
jgi:hypothetical protein